MTAAVHVAQERSFRLGRGGPLTPTRHVDGQLTLQALHLHAMHARIELQRALLGAA